MPRMSDETTDEPDTIQMRIDFTKGAFTRVWVKGQEFVPVERLAAADEALSQAVEVIKQWHGPEAWELYWGHAPEMKAVRAYYAAKEKAE